MSASALLDKWVHEHEVAQGKLARLDQALAGQDWAGVKEAAQWLFDELKPHNEAEERWLFPRMAEKLGTGPGPIAAMLAEHRHIWGHEEALMACLEQLPPPDPAKAARHAQEIVETLSAHIFKENNVLYPMAERMLGPQALAALDQEYLASEA
jgi:iron-sulfur cluster repair protein YtfE (RIC family)